MKQITVIGDIHGCFDTFLELLKKIPEGDTIVSVGDLVDRGPKSMQVVQYMIDHPEILVVKANHEELMYKGDKDNRIQQNWMMNGGNQTFDSYLDKKGNFNRELFQTHIKWMENLPLCLEFPDVRYNKGLDSPGAYLVVSHASVGRSWHLKDPNHPSHSSFEQDATWNRDTPQYKHEIYNIFGHTPNVNPKIESYYANIDTGCVFNRNGYNQLTAIRFPSLEIIQQENIEK